MKKKFHKNQHKKLHEIQGHKFPVRSKIKFSAFVYGLLGALSRFSSPRILTICFWKLSPNPLTLTYKGPHQMTF
jgi:hypothetical protein